MVDIHCNNINVVRFVNQPVPSNAYLIVNADSQTCFVVDPGSKENNEIEAYVISHKLKLEYIFLTHEHFDHVWGVNNLVRCFPSAQVMCTKLCKEWIEIPMNYFNKLYYNSEEMFCIDSVKQIVEDINYHLDWHDNGMIFLDTPGHTNRGMCISINNYLFTGDTLMNGYKPFLKKKYGASILDLKKSIDMIFSNFTEDTIVCPGHGDMFNLGEVQSFYKDYFASKGIY